MATTGPRILLRFDVAGSEMGQEVRGHGPWPALVEAASEVPIVKVDLVGNGEDIMRHEPGDCVVTWSFEVPACRELRSYYVRVTRQDGELAWSSPIWIKPTS